MSSRSSFWRCSVRKGVLGNFANPQENSCATISFFKKVAGLRPAILLKKRLCLEFLSYEIESGNRVTQNDVILRNTNSKIFIEILLSSY